MTAPTKTAIIDELCEKFQTICVDYGHDNECKYVEIPHYKLLRELLSDSVMVTLQCADYEGKMVPIGISIDEHSTDTHTALLISIKPTQRKVKKSEIVDAIRMTGDAGPAPGPDYYRKLADRIEQHGIEGE